MSLLEMKNIKKSFNGVEVLKDISLKVGRDSLRRNIRTRISEL